MSEPGKAPGEGERAGSDGASASGGGAAGGRNARAQTPAGALQLTVPGTYEAIANARGALAQWLKIGGVKPRVVSEMALVLTEICNNAVEHGSASPDNPITLAANFAEDQLRFEVIEGVAAEVNPVVEGLLAASTPPDQASERGRGFFLIRAYVDDLQVDTSPEGRLRIRFHKRFRT